MSLVDLTVTLSTPVADKEALIAAFREAAQKQPGWNALKTLEGDESADAKAGQDVRLRGVMDVNDEKLVSSDYLSTSFSCNIDVDATVMLNDTTAKIVAWYDNEYGFSSRSESIVHCAVPC